MIASDRTRRRILAGTALLPLVLLLAAGPRTPEGAHPAPDGSPPTPASPAASRCCTGSRAAPDWRADAERRWRREWASSSCASSNRIARVTAPRAQGRWAYRFEVRDGDDSYGERCELGQGNPRRHGFPVFDEGEKHWISWQVYLPDNYPIHTHSWNVFTQLKQLGSLGTPVVSMEVRNGRFHLMNSDTNHDSSDTRTKWTGRARRKTWVKFTLHVKFSPSASVGFMELFGDLGDGRGERRLTSRIHTYTMKTDGGRAVPSHARIGIYRDPSIRGTAQIYFDGYSIADSRVVAERSAFGRPPR
jgi:hypothetical protein